MARKHRYPPPTDPDEIRLIAECKKLGVELHRIGDMLQDSRWPDPTAPVPTHEIAELFVRELGGIQSDHLRATMLSAIAQPQFHDLLIPELVRALRREGDSLTGQRAANVFGEIALRADKEVLAELLLDKAVEGTRSLLLPTFARIAGRGGIDVLRRLVSDPDTRSYALKHLSILGDITIEPELHELAKHPDSYHRKIARDALKRVEKNRAKAESPSRH